MITDTLNTQQKIERTFACPGRVHITSGLVLLRCGKGYTCPKCGAPVTDITNTPEGQAYFAFGRPDLSKVQS
jgi:hypothetical protein